MKYVAYVRVSTEKQGNSGLGLEAQESTIRGFLKDGDTLVLPVMVEVETGTGKRNRPKLQEALEMCRLYSATLIVAKLDRLSRDAAFTKLIVRSDVPVVFCDVPASHGAMGRFFLSLIAELAELEAGIISERTTAALAARKARGLPMGGDRGFRHTKEDAARISKMGSAQLQAQALDAATRVKPVIDHLRASEPGASLNRLANLLNEKGATTPRGKTWTATAVKRALERIEVGA